MNAKLFVLDPLQAYLGGVDMHRANRIRPLMKALGAVAERTGCAIVIIGHLNKGTGKAPYRGLGSIDIYAAARSVLTVERPDETTRAMAHSKSNLTPPGASQMFGFDPNAGFFWRGVCAVTSDELLSGKQIPPKPGTQLDKAKHFLASTLGHDTVPATEIQAAARARGISVKTLHRAKGALGIISVKRQSTWFWHSPPTAEHEDSQGGQPYTVTAVTILSAQKESA